MVKYNLKNLRIKENSTILTPFFIFFLLFFLLPNVQRFCFISLCLVNFIYHSIRLGLLITNYISFSSLKNVLISHLLLQDVFIGYRILGWPFFSFNTWKILCHFLNSLVSMTSDFFFFYWKVFFWVWKKGTFFL